MCLTHLDCVYSLRCTTALLGCTFRASWKPCCISELVIGHRSHAIGMWLAVTVIYWQCTVINMTQYVAAAAAYWYMFTESHQQACHCVLMMKGCLQQYSLVVDITVLQTQTPHLLHVMSALQQVAVTKATPLSLSLLWCPPIVNVVCGADSDMFWCSCTRLPLHSRRLWARMVMPPWQT